MKRFLISLMAILLIVFVAFAGLLVANAPPGSGANAVSLITAAAERVPSPVLAIAADVLLAPIAAVGVCWLLTSQLYNHGVIGRLARNAITFSRNIFRAAYAVRGNYLNFTWRSSWRGWSLPLQTDWYAA